MDTPYRKTGILFLFIILLSLAGCASLRTSVKDEYALCREPVVIKSVNGTFDEIWEDLKMALNDRGLVVSSVSHVSEMLERTGKALNRTKRIYGQAKVMEFCSAVISRNMLERNPHFISFCPYQIMVYTLPDNENKVYLSYRRLIWKDSKDRDVLEAVERLLEGLIDDVIEEHGEFK
jgi:uncharacterized protein (DUF302 family)